MPQQKSGALVAESAARRAEWRIDRDAMLRYFTIVIRVVAITPSPRIRTK
jgi:hypothetical protein